MPDTYKTAIQKLLAQPNWRRQAGVAQVIRNHPQVPSYQIYADLGLTEEPVSTMGGMVAGYQDYIRNIGKFRVRFGYSELDQIIRGMAPAEVCGFIARAGVGKTLFAQNLIYRVTKFQQIPILFFSLEQPKEQTYERLAAISLDMTTKDVEKTYTTRLADDLTSAMVDLYPKLIVVDQDAMSFDQMEDRLAKAEAITQEKIPLVIIDYLGYMRGVGKTDYERVSNLSKELKAFAKRRQVAVFVIHQTSRDGGSGGTPVTLRSARDSGVFEESCDYILGAWRPELDSEASESARMLSNGVYQIAILKNRSGRLGQVTLEFNAHGENMRIE